jgi:hypothetical protein
MCRIGAPQFLYEVRTVVGRAIAIAVRGTHGWTRRRDGRWRRRRGGRGIAVIAVIRVCFLEKLLVKRLPVAITPEITVGIF